MTVAAGTVALNIICEGLFVHGLTDNDDVTSSKNIPNSRLECKNYTLFMTKMAKFDTLFYD